MTRGCRIHLPGTLPCRHCERARVANEAALADVVPRPASGRPADTRLTDEDVARIQRERAEGVPVHVLADRYRKRTTTIKDAIAGRYQTLAIVRKRHGERALPVPGQYQRMAATPLPRSAR